MHRMLHTITLTRRFEATQIVQVNADFTQPPKKEAPTQPTFLFDRTFANSAKQYELRLPAAMPDTESDVDQNNNDDQKDEFDPFVIDSSNPDQDDSVKPKEMVSFSPGVQPRFVTPMPWFGLDIGGTLTKLVYFEPTDGKDYFETEEELLSGRMIQRYLTTNKAYGEAGIRDEHLELTNVAVNERVGTLHFIRFPTSQMPTFISLVKEKGFALMSSTVCATGGGAVKYGKEAEFELSMQLHKSDELESLIKGIEFVAAANVSECYYYKNPLDDERCRKVNWKWSKGCCSSQCADQAHANQESLQYPYIVVNIGSGVSVMAVYDQHNFKRVSGSSIGGGFFQGLCCLLCGCESFDEAVMLAAKGNNKNIDKLVKDIYGSGYDHVGLPEDTVAASFGKLCSREACKNATPEDLAHSALVTTTNNIGAVALTAANNCNIDRIVFVGNFLRVNPIASRLLSNAMDFWSRGTKKALFLEHEGYFGAVGCLDKLVAVTELRRKQRETFPSDSSSENSESSS